MGLFDRFKKKEEKKGAVLPGFVLLSDASLDLDALVKQIHDDWEITIPADDIREGDEKGEDDEIPALVSTVDNKLVAISLMPAPVPNGEAVQNAKTNFRWPEAVAVTESHKAHILVAVLPQGNQSVWEIATLQAKLCSSCLKLPNAIAINTAGTVFSPDAYKESAKLTIENDRFPIFNHVFFGMYSNDDGKTISAYTFGLESLGKQELEILNSEKDADEVYDLIVEISIYLMESDATLKHGETIGFSAEHKLTVTESKGVAVEGKTLKIGF